MAKKLVGAIVTLSLLGGLSAFVYAMTSNKVVFGYNQNYQPDQPFKFNHKLHAGKYKIDCKYCHVGADKSRHASVPSLNICMNCHIQVRGQTAEAKERIKSLQSHYKENRPVQWEKVHLLPDHVKFNHAAHIRKGKQCTECHGKVENMSVVKQVNSLSMGWCVNCHRKPENNANINCGTCHY